MRNRILLKSALLGVIRSVMISFDFAEVTTPSIRRGTNPVFKRHEVKLGGPHNGRVAYLRDCHEGAMRSLLRYHDRVFEIGPSFRLDEVDDSHRPEFSLFEACANEIDLSFLMNLTRNILERFWQNHGVAQTVNVVSIQQYMEAHLGVDISKIDGDKLKEVIIKSDPNIYGVFTAKPHFYCVNSYIKNNLEQSSGTVFLTDYPACTISIAKRRNSSNVIERFELFVDGLEVANSYLYEDDLKDLEARCREVGLYNLEEQIVLEMLASETKNTCSGVLGIGVERMCSAITSAPLSDYVFAEEFSSFQKGITHSSIEELK